MIIFRRTNMSSILTLLTLELLATAHSGVEHRVVLCVSSIASRYFVPGQPLVISTPSSDRHVADRAPILHSTQIQLLDAVFSSLHGQWKWPILISRSDELAVSSDAAHKHQSYVIFLWPEHRNDVADTLRHAMDSLLMCTNSFNHRAKFVLVLLGHKQPFCQSDIINLLEIMWNPYKIINVLVMLPTAAGTLNEFSTDWENSVLSLYTWLPYDSNVCGQVKRVELLDQWLPEGDGRFRSNADLFPSEVPRNLHGCPLTVAPIERIPFVKLTNSYTDSSGDITYVYGGLEIEYILFVTRAMNFTPVFLEPRVGDFVQVRVEVFMEMAQGMVDLTVGTHPLHPLLVTVGDATRPYYEMIMRWWVPCAAPATRTDKVTAIFTPSVWVSVMIVFILTATAFWRTALQDGEDRAAFRTFTRNFYTVWAVFLGVSVQTLPTTHRLRSMFLLYVWYSFAMSTVLQVLFISFLVNPGYEKGINTFQDLVESGLKFATDARMMSFANASGYWEYLNLQQSTDTCSPIDECLKHLVTHKNITTVSSALQFQYVLATLGKTEDKARYLCTIPETVDTTKFALYVSKGNPLLPTIDAWIQRAIESGIVCKYWSQFVWNVTLQGVANRGSAADQSDSHMFFVFTVSHLSPAFCQLLAGYLLSLVVLMAEFVHCRIYLCRI
jgi:hypothetical protein